MWWILFTQAGDTQAAACKLEQLSLWQLNCSWNVMKPKRTWLCTCLPVDVSKGSINPPSSLPQNTLEWVNGGVGLYILSCRAQCLTSIWLVNKRASTETKKILNSFSSSSKTATLIHSKQAAEVLSSRKASYGIHRNDSVHPPCQRCRWRVGAAPSAEPHTDRL